MIARLLPVNAGQPREIAGRGQTVRTSVWKDPGHGKRMARRLNIGGALFEVIQPRVACERIGIRMNEPRMAALLVSHGRPGFYFRALQESEVEAGKELNGSIAKGNAGLTRLRTSGGACFQWRRIR